RVTNQKLEREKSELEKNNDTIKQFEKKLQDTQDALKEILEASSATTRIVHGDHVYPDEKEMEERRCMNKAILKELEILEP
ncbi:MAG: hypothetical protein IIA83_08095, partial [Thaumarchaeota archaeon]|nr:hypothetical protein [Nitrososphaerota archaeon]